MSGSLSTVLQTATYFRDQHAAGNVPAYEEHLKAAYRTFVRPGDFCVDVGVHHGEHFRELLTLGARVIGFEPCPDFSPGDNPYIIRKAVSSQQAVTRTFYQDQNRPGASGLAPTLDNRTVTTMYGVQVTTLDLECYWPEWPHVDLSMRYLKIDVEGHEMDVLEGGRATLRHSRPIISVEFSAATFKAHGRWDTDLWEWAEREGYLIGDLWGNTVTDIAEWRAVVDCSYWDYLLWPKTPEGEAARAALKGA